MSAPNDNIQYKVVVATVFALVISNLAVILRLLARRLTKISLQIDDYLIIFALIFEWGIATSGIVLLKNGLGRHLSTISSHQLENYLKTLYSGPFLYAGTITCTKLSLLWLYHRVFPTRTINISCIIVGAVVALWAIITTLVGALICDPVSKVWHPEIPGKCLDLVSFYYGLQIPNIVTDILIIALPIRTILKLPLERSQKASLVGIFAVGTLTVTFDIVRLVVLVQLGHGGEDITYADVNGSVWTCVEPAIAILGACLPHLRPLRKLFTQQRRQSMRRKELPSTANQSSAGTEEAAEEVKLCCSTPDQHGAYCTNGLSELE